MCLFVSLATRDFPQKLDSGIRVIKRYIFKRFVYLY